MELTTNSGSKPRQAWHTYSWDQKCPVVKSSNRNTSPNFQGRALSSIKEDQGKIEIPGVKRLGLFGSYARNEQAAESDIDLLVEFDQAQKTFDTFIRLAFLLENMLEHRVELVTTGSLSPYIGPHIIDEVEYVDLTT